MWKFEGISNFDNFDALPASTSDSFTAALMGAELAHSLEIDKYFES